MPVRAVVRAKSRKSATPDGYRRALGLLCALAGATAPGSAAAQIGASLSVANDARFRGRSISDGRPVASVDLSFDTRSGVYLGGTGQIVASRDDGVQPLSIQGYAGYAKRLAPAITLDLGATATHYTRYYSSGGWTASYAEAYVGIVTNHVSAHLHYSPSYYRSDTSVLYAELDAVMRPAENWRISGHAGLLSEVRQPPGSGASSQYYDWRVGVSRTLGRLDLHVAYAAQGAHYAAYSGRLGYDGGVVAGATYIF